jgi:hypothetical protein
MKPVCPFPSEHFQVLLSTSPVPSLSAMLSPFRGGIQRATLQGQQLVPSNDRFPTTKIPSLISEFIYFVMCKAPGFCIPALCLPA